MALNIHAELKRLGTLKTPLLKARYAELFGETTRCNNRPYLIKRICWRLQADAEGDFSERARQRAAELADDADLRLQAPSGSAGPTTISAAAVLHLWQVATMKTIGSGSGYRRRRPFEAAGYSVRACARLGSGFRGRTFGISPLDGLSHRAGAEARDHTKQQKEQSRNMHARRLHAEWNERRATPLHAEPGGRGGGAEH